jgi:type IV pilus biogenesis protein CpaD/CtpE
MGRIVAVDTLLSAGQTRGRRQARVIGRVLGVALVSLIAACASTGAIPTLYDTQERIARYIGSGQYEKGVRSGRCARAGVHGETRRSRE